MRETLPMLKWRLPKTHPVFNVHKSWLQFWGGNETGSAWNGKIIIKDKIDFLKCSLSETVSVVCIDILHGLADDVMTDIIKKCDILSTPDDLMKNFPICSYEIAIQICSVIC